MDRRFKVNDPPRDVPIRGLARLPLVTVAWRTLRTHYRQQAEARRQAAVETRRRQNVLAGIAEDVYRLRQGVQSVLARATSDDPGGEMQQLLAIADHLEETLAGEGMTVIAPQGEPFTPELMNVFESIAQRPVPGIDAPRVDEVVAPAVMYRETLLRTGKAVIAVPVVQVGEEGQ
jgi:molecular chaperone GrpE (heat shock protein)